MVDLTKNANLTEAQVALLAAVEYTAARSGNYRSVQQTIDVAREFKQWLERNSY